MYPNLQDPWVVVCGLVRFGNIINSYVHPRRSHFHVGFSLEIYYVLSQIRAASRLSSTYPWNSHGYEKSWHMHILIRRSVNESDVTEIIEYLLFNTHNDYFIESLIELRKLIPILRTSTLTISYSAFLFFTRETKKCKLITNRKWAERHAPQRLRYSRVCRIILYILPRM